MHHRRNLCSKIHLIKRQRQYRQRGHAGVLVLCRNQNNIHAWQKEEWWQGSKTELFLILDVVQMWHEDIKSLSMGGIESSGIERVSVIAGNNGAILEEAKGSDGGGVDVLSSHLSVIWKCDFGCRLATTNLFFKTRNARSLQTRTVLSRLRNIDGNQPSQERVISRAQEQGLESGPVDPRHSRPSRIPLQSRSTLSSSALTQAQLRDPTSGKIITERFGSTSSVSKGNNPFLCVFMTF